MMLRASVVLGAAGLVAAGFDIGWAAIATETQPPTSILGAFLVIAMGAFGAIVYVIKHLLTVTIPNLSATFAAALNRVTDECQVTHRELNATFISRTQTLIDICREERKEDRASYERQLDLILKGQQRR